MDSIKDKDITLEKLQSLTGTTTNRPKVSFKGRVLSKADVHIQKLITCFNSLQQKLDYLLSLMQRSITKLKSAIIFPTKKTTNASNETKTTKSTKDGNYWKTVPLSTNPKELEHLAVDSSIAQLPYNLNQNPIECWQKLKEAENILADFTDKRGEKELCTKVNHVFFEALVNSQQKNNNPDQTSCALNAEQQEMARDPLFKNITLLPSGMIIDHITGFTALMVVNKKNHRLTLVFGGTNSANGASKLLDSSGQEVSIKPGRLRAQLKADCRNLIGNTVPDCYKQADKLVALINKIVKNKQTMADMGMKESHGLLYLTGHSLGGGLVQYAGVKNRVPGRTFNPAALGYAVIQDLEEEDKQLAKTGLIDNYLISGDPVNVLWGNQFLHKRFNPTILGLCTITPAHKETGKNTLHGCHSYSHLHLIAEIKARLAKARQRSASS